MDFTFIVQVGEWQFETKQIRGIRTSAYGQPYSATVMITVVNGVAYVEGLLAREDQGITKQDVKDITAFLGAIGFKSYVFDRYKDGKKSSKIKSIHNETKSAP